MATELLDDRAYRAVPLTDADAADLIARPAGRAAAGRLPGRAGGRRAEPLIDLALRLSALADDLPEVVDLQLRPVLAGPAGVAVTAATGRIGPPSPTAGRPSPAAADVRLGGRRCRRHRAPDSGPASFGAGRFRGDPAGDEQRADGDQPDQRERHLQRLEPGGGVDAR